MALATRSVRERFVNGEPMPIGYLSGLRIDPMYRNRTILARGFRFLRELHKDNRTRLYVTTIVESNQQAKEILTSGRAGLPRYQTGGRFYTCAVAVSVRSKRSANGSVVVRSAKVNDLESVVDFLRKAGRGRQFFPSYTTSDFFDEGTTFRGLNADDLMLAFDSGRLVGMLGAWDQRPFRQQVVEAYSGTLKWIRPFYNAAAAALGRSVLPAPGQPLRSVPAALPVIADARSDVLLALLVQIQKRAAAAGCDFVLIGLHETDALLPTVRRLATTSFVTQLYYAFWDDGERLVHSLDDRSPWLELGCL